MSELNAFVVLAIRSCATAQQDKSYRHICGLLAQGFFSVGWELVLLQFKVHVHIQIIAFLIT